MTALLILSIMIKFSFQPIDLKSESSDFFQLCPMAVDMESKKTKQIQKR